MFKTGQALPLRQRRTWGPRMSRGRHAEYPRSIVLSWTWHWPVHGLGSAGTKTWKWIFQIRERSMSEFNPRQQSCPRTVHVRAQATASIARKHVTEESMNCPQRVRRLERSMFVNWSCLRFGREHEQAKNCPRRRIAVSFLPKITFPIHARILTPYAHV